MKSIVTIALSFLFLTVTSCKKEGSQLETPESVTPKVAENKESPKPTKPIWIGVGSHGYISSTANGVDWTSQGGGKKGEDPHTPDLLRDIAYGNGVFIAVGGDKNALIKRTENGGFSWEDVSLDSNEWLGGVEYHKKTWIVGAGYSGKIYRSKDEGKTWEETERTSSEIPVRKAGIRGITAIGSKVYAHGDRGALYESEDTGESWKDISIKDSKSRIKSITKVGSNWIVADKKYCAVSEDLETWTKPDIDISSILGHYSDRNQFTLFTKGQYHSTLNGTNWYQGPCPVIMAEKLGDTWVAIRYGDRYKGTALDQLEKVNTTKQGDFRSFASGYIY